MTCRIPLTIFENKSWLWFHAYYLVIDYVTWFNAIHQCWFETFMNQSLDFSFSFYMFFIIIIESIILRQFWIFFFAFIFIIRTSRMPYSLNIQFFFVLEQITFFSFYFIKRLEYFANYGIWKWLFKLISVSTIQFLKNITYFETI